LSDANSTEFHTATAHPVVCLLDEQRKVTNLGGTMRLGAFDCIMTEGSRARLAYGQAACRNGIAIAMNSTTITRDVREVGLQVSGTSPDGGLVEVIELPAHPWFVAVQCHPEFKSNRPNRKRCSRLRRGPACAGQGRERRSCRLNLERRIQNVACESRPPGEPGASATGVLIEILAQNSGR